MGQLFCAPFDQSQRTAFVFAARIGYLRAGARVVSDEAFRPLTQILATGRVPIYPIIDNRLHSSSTNIMPPG
jgi:hypothetical protein